MPIRSRNHRSSYLWMVLLLGVLNSGSVRADEAVVTTLADFEDNSIAMSINDVDRLRATDCSVGLASIPARGQNALIVEISATKSDAAVACDLRFRLATPFQQADRVATYVWLKQGEVDLAFRVSDSTGHIFETARQTIKDHNRWVRVVADLSANNLIPVRTEGSAVTAPDRKLGWPIQILGYRICSHGIGRQAVYLDDLEIEHRTDGAGILRGEFKLDHPTHTYKPGALVKAAVVLENNSRRRALPLNVQLEWLRSDGSELTKSNMSINLPASGESYRSRQPVDFSQTIDAPGLYRLAARVSGSGWSSPARFETTIAVTYSNRALPRGRATFFGLQTNLMREPPTDQLLELEIARELGAQMLALETPWRMIEPRPGIFELDQLDALIKQITQRDMAAMVVLTEPPNWLAEDPGEAWEQQAVLFETLTSRYGERIVAYQPYASAVEQPGPEEMSAAAELRKRVSAIRSGVEICPPALRITSGVTAAPGEFAASGAYETSGDVAEALTALDAYAATAGQGWTSQQRWFHRAAAMPGYGVTQDAVAILRHYVHAAAQGVGGVVWFDLRDDTSDPRYPEQMRGLFKRDFSPKIPVLGYTNAVGMLNGLVYAGALPGTPAEYDSALFVGGTRQVAVLFPKPNRCMPGVLTPYQVVAGDLGVFDFDRRFEPLLLSEAPPLALAHQTPFFLMLDSQRAQSDPKIGLARPWLRVPETVYCSEEATFRIELDAPMRLQRSYLQIQLPPESPVDSSLATRALRGEQGTTHSFDVTLKRIGESDFEPVTLTIRLRLEGQVIQVPVRVAPLREVLADKPGQKISAAEFTIGRLASSIQKKEAAQDAPVLHATYQNRKLLIGVELPANVPPDAKLKLGLAVENAERHAEITIAGLTEKPRLSPGPGTTAEQIQAWRCEIVEGGNLGSGLCTISLPARVLELNKFEPGTQLLLAVRYEEPATDAWSVARILEWGRGLDGSRVTTGYNWLRLQ